MRWPVAICRAHSYQNQNFLNSVQFKWRQISLASGDSTSCHQCVRVDAHEPEPARTRPRTSDCMFDSYVVVTTSLDKQRDAGLQLRENRSSSATCTVTSVVKRPCPTTCKSLTRSTRPSTLWPVSVTGFLNHGRRSEDVQSTTGRPVVAFGQPSPQCSPTPESSPLTVRVTDAYPLCGAFSRASDAAAESKLYRPPSHGH
jgi:hypothetical protein